MVELIYEYGIKIFTAEEGQIGNSYHIMPTFKVGFEEDSGFVVDTFTDLF
jgi:hypothetical protein